MTDELWERVQRFGLTEKEADTYIAILEDGPATIMEIANTADISKRHVYNVAKKLEERRFVIVNDYFTPTTIEMTPPEEVYESLRDEAEALFQEVEQRYDPGMDQTEEVRVLKSRSTVINTIIELIKDADSRIAMSIPANALPMLVDPLREAVERDVAVLLLVFEGESNTTGLPDVKLDGIAHVIRYRNDEAAVLLAVDKTTALVSPRGAITQPHSQVNAILFGQPYLESIVFTSLISAEWLNASQIAVGSPSQLPETYTNFRRAVIDAALHRQDGSELIAEIEARPKDHSETVVDLEGEVVKVRQQLVEPVTDPDPGQSCLQIRTDKGVVNVGGKDAHLEEYRAFSTRLRAKVD